MKKRILAYRKRIDALLDQDNPETDWTAVLQEHVTQVSFFQHERVVHLIVTVVFALLEMLAFILVQMSGTIACFVLAGLFMILLIPYVMHYYLLENEVQKMYNQYDEIVCRQKGERRNADG